MNTRPSGGIHLVSCAGVLGISRCGSQSCSSSFILPRGLGGLNPFLLYPEDKGSETFLAIYNELFIIKKSYLHQIKDTFICLNLVHITSLCNKWFVKYCQKGFRPLIHQLE